MTADSNNWWFPKDHIGQRSFAGRRAAQSLIPTIENDPNMVWLHKNRFNATAKNRGGKLEVKVRQDEVVLDGYMSYGHVTTDAYIHAWSALQAFGPYTDRGTFVLETGFTADSSLVLNYYGKGYGSTLTVKQGDQHYDFNNRLAWVDEVTHYTTWDGKEFKPDYTFKISQPYIGEGYAYAIVVPDIPGSTIDNIETMTAHGCITLDPDQQYRAFLLLDDGAARTRSPILTLNYQLPIMFQPYRMSPHNLVAFTSYLRPQYDQWAKPFPIDVTPEGNPGLHVQYSTNNGASWTKGNLTNWAQEFNDTVLILAGNIDNSELPPGSPIHTNTFNSKLFNTCVYWANFFVAPLSPTHGVVYGSVPYLEVVTGTPENPDTVNYKAKVKMGTIDAAGNVSGVITLFDGDMYTAASICAGGGIPVKGGVVLRFNDPSAGSPVRFIFTTNGVGGTISTDVGAHAGNMGGLNGFGVGRLDVTYYDSEYVIYESLDNGMTWARKGVVTKVGQPPSGTAGGTALINYYRVTHLRENGVPAGASQTAPWVTNTKYPPPE